MSKIKKIKLLASACICAAIFLSGCGKNSKTETAITKQEVTVTKPVQIEMPFSKELNGKIVAMDQVNIVARVKGFIEKIYFKNGAIVQEGEPLYLIEQTEYKADLAKAEADLANQNIAVKLAESEYNRQHSLYYSDKGANATQQALESAMSDLANAKTALAKDKAYVDVAKTNLSYTLIKAPFAGQTGTSNYSLGSMVSSESGTLVSLIKLNPIEVEFFPDEKLFLTNSNERKMAEQVSVGLVMSNGSTYSQTGKVVYFDNQVDSATGTIRLRAEFPNPDSMLLPGQYVKVKLQMPVKQKMLSIPQRSVMTNQGVEYVYVVNNNVVESKRIETANTVGKDIIVTKGLSETDSVIVSGLQKVKDGQEVTVQPEGK